MLYKHAEGLAIVTINQMKFDISEHLRITRSATVLVVCITLFGFYSLYKNLTAELEEQTYQATEEVLVDVVHLFAAHLESQLKQRNVIDHQLLQKSFVRAKKHVFQADIQGLKKNSVNIDTFTGTLSI